MKLKFGNEDTMEFRFDSELYNTLGFFLYSSGNRMYVWEHQQYLEIINHDASFMEYIKNET